MSDSDRSTSSGGISRRMLTGAGALVPFGLLKLTTNSAGSRDPVLPLYLEWQRLQRSVTELCFRCQSLENNLIGQTATPEKEYDIEGETNGRTASPSTTFLPVPGLTSAPAATMADAVSEFAPILLNSIGWDELESLRAEEGEKWDELQRAADALLRTEAESLAGVAIKISLIVQMCSTGPADAEFPVPQLRSTLADLQRLCR